MGKRKWFRNGNFIRLLIGALGAGLIAICEFCLTEEKKKKPKRKRKKGGTRRKVKESKVVRRV